MTIGARTPFVVPWYYTAYRPIHIGTQTAEFHPKKSVTRAHEKDAVFNGLDKCGVKDCEKNLYAVSTAMKRYGKPTHGEEHEIDPNSIKPILFRAPRDEGFERTHRARSLSEAPTLRSLKSETRSTCSTSAESWGTRSYTDLHAYGRRGPYDVQKLQPAGVVSQYFRRFHVMNTSIPYH